MSQAGLVLVVEDEDPVRRYTVSLLEELGFPVLQASDGVEAIAILRERRAEVGVMLLDHSMPGLSGEEVLAELEREDLTVPVVLTSGYDRAALEVRFAGHEVAGYLQKPFRIEALDETVRAVVARRARAH
ncbi:Response regulator receiver domain-containing protein [Lentzea fradiae]|uniref:Response regulator receiver domain-containing protein n=1 Tax=Lentzea fradiae TaxID=200378 RepID=A0A1G8AGP3_9PSEU|nr:response regulator [Lentzea fradiae]SDH20016.1 Response regulator receiver domain-containing protein [Lentzea fradiae]